MPKVNKANPPAAGHSARRNGTSSRAKKISVTVDPGVLSAVQKEAKRKGRTLSAEISEALARDLRRKRLQALIEDYEAEHGLISDSELAELSSR